MRDYLERIKDAENVENQMKGISHRAEAEILLAKHLHKKSMNCRISTQFSTHLSFILKMFIDNTTLSFHII